jgi:uncharacterized protein YndB with AHSA1/START domain
MSDTDAPAEACVITADDVFPHPPAAVWKALTTPALMARWLHMAPDGFTPEVGSRFTYKTTPAGAWDGTIRCEVLEVIPNQRLVYSWRGGDAGNVGYGSLLDTIVTFTLERVDGGTRLRAVHSGFVLPRNETAYRNMSGGWSKVVATIGAIAGE